MNSYGFIVTRHVNSEKTNKYWNRCIQLLRKFYPFRKIVLIDDNSNYNYVKPEYEYPNIEIIQSEFPRRGELLPYYYLLKYKFFNNAIIIHDSVFFHKRINFDKLNGIKVLPLWHFNPDKENMPNRLRIANYLKNNKIVYDKMMNEGIIKMPYNQWYGCFGVQCYINLQFLQFLEVKYKITNLLNVVHCRNDRCSLERIFGILFFTENPGISYQKSLFGDILRYPSSGSYTFDNYMHDFKNKNIKSMVIKVWTGR